MGQGIQSVLIAVGIDDIGNICPVLHNAFNFSALDGSREVGGRSLESPDCPFVLQQSLGQGHRAQSSVEISLAQVKAEDWLRNEHVTLAPGKLLRRCCLGRAAERCCPGREKPRQKPTILPLLDTVHQASVSQNQPSKTEQREWELVGTVRG